MWSNCTKPAAAATLGLAVLDKHEDLLIAALKARPGLHRTLKTVGSLPKVPDADLLKQYVADAPAIYLAEPTLSVESEAATLRFKLCILVRHAGGPMKARKGDAIDVGVDVLFVLAARALHGKRIGDTTWNMTRGAMVDEPLFARSGLAAMEVDLVSTPVLLPYEWDEDTADVALDELRHVHLDFDLVPHSETTAAWLQNPPDYTADRPDMQADEALPGATP